MLYNTYGYYDYGTTSAASGAAAGVGIVAFLGAMIVPMIITIAIYAVIIVGMWKVFTKAGKAGWISLIPFYNFWVLFEFSGYEGWKSLMSLIPFVGWIIQLYFSYLAYTSLAKKFHKEPWFAFVLLLVPFVGFPMLGFGKCSYDASLGEPNK